jgi:prepilin-type N-terminal cleavage/methylation domain-containing protein
MQRTGLTLIELMVALAIVGLVTAGVLGVVTNLSHGQGARQREMFTSRQEAGLDELLRLDLQHATKLQLFANGILITSNAGLAEETNELEHVSCEIRYEIKTIAERNWLLRFQKRSANAQEKEVASIVCADVKEIQIEIPEEAEKNQAKWESIPNEFVIHFAFTDVNRELLSVAFHGLGI